MTFSLVICIKGMQPPPNKILLTASELTRLPPFQDIELGKNRKEIFINYIGSIIQSENQRIEVTRQRIRQSKENFENNQIEIFEIEFLRFISEKYRVKSDFSTQLISGDLFDVLLEHVDKIPQSLAIAQASLESGWGTSRFAQEANNLFGVWCYTPNCGLTPKQRSANAKHQVARFETPQESVREYMQLLNSHPAYRNFRQTRRDYQEKQLSLHGCVLARELHNYSELKEEYIHRLLQVIRVNKLEDPNLLKKECKNFL